MTPSVIVDNPLPQLAQPALQTGKHAAQQITRIHLGQPTVPFEYHNKGTMATIGRADAVVQLPNGLKLTGIIAWLGWIALHIMFLLGSRNRIQTLINLAVRYSGLGRSGVIVGDVAETPTPEGDQAEVGRSDPIVDSTWWRTAVIYQVYPRSFADSDGDGVGDLPGITSRLTSLAALGVDAVWLSPFFSSPQVDAGYDVSDYCDVDPVFGTLADLDALLARAHDLGLKVIVDLVPNHTSDQHPWFRAALADGPGSPARARYHFRDEPTDWQSVFGGPAWTRVSDGQSYLHLYDPAQPDLNWANPEVRAEFERILRFWLDRGVDGFRVDVAHGLVKDPSYPSYGGSPLGLLAKRGAPYWDQDGVHDIYRSWRAILDAYTAADPSRPRILCGEANVAIERAIRYVRPDELHQTFNFPYLQTPLEPVALRQVIDDSLTAYASVGAPATWVLSNHDVVRHASRYGYPADAQPRMGVGADDPQPDAALGLRRARAAILLMLALPGSAYLYQGEELGLPEHTDDAGRRAPGPELGALGPHRAGS